MLLLLYNFIQFGIRGKGGEQTQFFGAKFDLFWASFERLFGKLRETFWEFSFPVRLSLLTDGALVRAKRGSGNFHEKTFRACLPLSSSKKNITKILSLAAFRPPTFLEARLLLFASPTIRFSTATTIMSSAKKNFKRLPTSVLPKNYKLCLKPNLTEFTFTGKEVIDVEV